MLCFDREQLALLSESYIIVQRMVSFYSCNTSIQCDDLLYLWGKCVTLHFGRISIEKDIGSRLARLPRAVRIKSKREKKDLMRIKVRGTIPSNRYHCRS